VAGRGRFTLDGGSEYVDYTVPYSVTYTGVAMAERTVGAVIVDNFGSEIAGPTTQDQVTPVGIGDSITAGGVIIFYQIIFLRTVSILKAV